MKINLRTIFLAVAVWSALVFNSLAAESGAVNLVNPVVPTAVKEALTNAVGRVCEDRQVLQKNGTDCCPEGTDNNLWQNICTPVGTVARQIFKNNGSPFYCPNADMFIVSDKHLNRFSCADKDSRPMYSAAKGFTGSKFCGDHGYGSLLKINPKGTVGCVKVGDSQGDGCIEAGTCSFSGK